MFIVIKNSGKRHEANGLVAEVGLLEPGPAALTV